MAGIRNYSDIIKGSTLMVFIGDKPVGFATQHNLSVSLATTEVSCKDSGDFNSVTPQNITWEVTAENLYSDAGEATYMAAITNKTKVSLKFAKAGNYAPAGEQGVLGPDGHEEWTVGTVIAQGEAYLTSFQINAPSGENATMSVTFTGLGALTVPSE